MSRQNVEIARGIAEAFSRDDPKAALAWLAQDVEWHDLSDQPDAEVHHGHQAFLATFEQFFREFEDHRVNLDETIDRGERIVVCARIIGRGRGSGASFEQRVFGVWTLRNGLVARAVWFRTREEALEAVSLPG
jgi:ketosteroid isomerase-like protein